jgi:hypothetical protein
MRYIVAMIYLILFVVGAGSLFTVVVSMPAEYRSGLGVVYGFIIFFALCQVLIAYWVAKDGAEIEKMKLDSGALWREFHEGEKTLVESKSKMKKQEINCGVCAFFGRWNCPVKEENPEAVPCVHYRKETQTE